MALRQHRLPRFWLAITLGSVAIGVGGVYWWERQLPSRIERAAATGRLDDCLRYGDQLEALSGLPVRSPQERGRCQRQRAAQLWQAKQWDSALSLQRQLVHSSVANASDRQHLKQWQVSLRQQAMSSFEAGDLNGALAALVPLGEGPRGDGHSLGDELTETWNRNRVQLQRAEQLTAQARWWEALDALNRIDHPWWQRRSADVRRRLEQGMSTLKGAEREHEAHGDLPHGVDPQKLDRIVQQHIAAGMNEWKAFETACRQLGGRVVEAGPETTCQP
ncbi:MAG: hypothetical protein NTY67_00800 [Cyanobacteria bacterium]|nr:hypothetical protein [Cyanobacteriota bacterium]